MRGTPVERILRIVFLSAHPTNADMESEAFLEGYLEKYYSK